MRGRERGRRGGVCRRRTSAQQLRLSFSLQTMLGSFCRACPGIRCMSQLNRLVWSPSFCSRVSVTSPSSSTSDADADPAADSNSHSSSSHSSSVLCSNRRRCASPKSPLAATDERATRDPPRSERRSVTRPPTGLERAASRAAASRAAASGSGPPATPPTPAASLREGGARWSIQTRRAPEQRELGAGL